MTDRYLGFIVTLDQGVREDDAEPLVNAIACIKGVIDVQPVVSDAKTALLAARIRRELLERLYRVLERDDDAGREG